MCSVSDGSQAGRSAQVAWIQEVFRRAKVVQGISFDNVRRAMMTPVQPGASSQECHHCGSEDLVLSVHDTGIMDAEAFPLR